METGTYLGEMVDAQKKKFKEIITIELDYNLYNKAVEKFKKYKHIKLYQGDSGEVLQKNINTIDTPCIFLAGWSLFCRNYRKGRNKYSD